jgi:hypothetical protein
MPHDPIEKKHDQMAILYCRMPNIQIQDLGVFYIGLALVGKDIVFRFIIEYNSLRDFGP